MYFYRKLYFLALFLTMTSVCNCATHFYPKWGTTFSLNQTWQKKWEGKSEGANVIVFEKFLKNDTKPIGTLIVTIDKVPDDMSVVSFSCYHIENEKAVVKTELIKSFGSVSDCFMYRQERMVESEPVISYEWFTVANGYGYRFSLTTPFLLFDNLSSEIQKIIRSIRVSKPDGTGKAFIVRVGHPEFSKPELNYMMLSDLRDIFVANSAKLSECYKKLEETKPGLIGLVHPSFAISKDGKVQSVHLGWSQMPMNYMSASFDIEKALSKEIANWSFSSIKSEVDYIVTIPLQFEIEE